MIAILWQNRLLMKCHTGCSNTSNEIVIPHECGALKRKQTFDWFQIIQISQFQMNSPNIRTSPILYSLG